MQYNADEILKISVFKSGKIHANNNMVSLQELDSLLAVNAQKNGEVWYYRESDGKEPPPQIYEVMDLVTKHSRPISMSSKPDFSDVIIEDGTSLPRKK